MHEPLGQLQLQVMRVVWELGKATVADVHRALSAMRRIAYTTVLTTMRSLERRGMLRHELSGKAFLYIPTVGRRDYADRSVASLVKDFFNGRRESLLCHLLGADKVTPADVEKIRKALSARRGDKR